MLINYTVDRSKIWRVHPVDNGKYFHTSNWCSRRISRCFFPAPKNTFSSSELGLNFESTIRRTDHPRDWRTPITMDTPLKFRLPSWKLTYPCPKKALVEWMSLFSSFPGGFHVFSHDVFKGAALASRPSTTCPYLRRSRFPGDRWWVHRRWNAAKQ